MNLITYSLQALAMIVAAALALRLFALPSAAARLVYWRAVVVVSVTAPLVWALMPAAPPEAVAAAFTLASRSRIAAASPVPAGWLIAAVVSGGAMLRLLWLAVGVLKIRQLRATSLPLDGDSELVELRDAMAPHAELRRHDSVRQPVTFGWRRPLVLLPSDTMTALDVEARRAVVCHELLHVARGDWPAKVGEELLRCAFWFHPAVTWALGQIDLNREQAVDEAVVRSVAGRQAYLAALVTFAAIDIRQNHALAFGGRRHLAARIRNLTVSSRVTARRALLNAFSLAALLGCVSWGAAWAMPLAGGAQSREKASRLSKEMTPPRVLHEVKPSYSPEAMSAKVEGDVVLDVEVDANGAVVDATVVQSIPLLDDSAIEAARQWMFEPAKLKGQPVAVLVSLQFTFTLK